MTIVFSRYIGPLCATIAKKKNILFKPLRYFGIDEWSNLKNKRYTTRFFIVAFYSALIGGLTHLLLDLPSHAEIKLFLDENEQLKDAQVKVVEIRGFEKFLIGRPAEEMLLNLKGKKKRRKEVEKGKISFGY